MPNEQRDIVFSENEVKIALMQFSARKGLVFKTENIQDFVINKNGEIAIAMKVFDAKENKTGTVKFNYQEIAAALMAYCMTLKVPLPKSGKKSVTIKDGDMVLNISLQS